MSKRGTHRTMPRLLLCLSLTWVGCGSQDEARPQAGGTQDAASPGDGDGAGNRDGDGVADLDGDGDGDGDTAGDGDVDAADGGDGTETSDASADAGGVGDGDQDRESRCDSDEALGGAWMFAEAGYSACLVFRGTPLQRISGLAVHPSGDVFAADVDAGLIVRIDPAAGSATTVLSKGQSPNIGNPDRIAFAPMKQPFTADHLLLADHNATPAAACCNGRVLAMDVSEASLPYLSLAEGSPGVPLGDAFGIALGNQSDEWGRAVYILDFQSASAEVPRLYHWDWDGTIGGVFTDPAAWPTTAVPLHLEMSPAGSTFPNGPYITARPSAQHLFDSSDPSTIWHVSGPEGNRSASEFSTSQPIATIASLRFEGHFDFNLNGSEELWVLGAGDDKLFRVDADGNTIEFAQAPADFDMDAASDMAFDPAAQRLYVGAKNAIYAIERDGK